MKIRKRQVEEIDVTVLYKAEIVKKLLDDLENKGYDTLRVGPRIKNNGWSYDMTQYQVIASRPISKWKKSIEI